MFRLVLNELKIKLDGVNESEESINGEFEQPRFGFLHFRVILSQKITVLLKITGCETLYKDLHHALDFAAFYYS